jgi:hypothetical protein
MRFALTALVLSLAGSTADAQVYYQNCQNGKCQTVGMSYSYGSTFVNSPPGTTYFLNGQPLVSPGPAPSANHELHLQGNRLVWVAKATATPKVAAATPDVPKEIIASYGEKSSGKPMHGERAYRIIRAIAERQLADEAVRKGYKPAEARAKAKELVGKLTDSNIDDIGVKMAGIKESIGDGVVGDRIDNILRIIDAIMKLLMLFL